MQTYIWLQVLPGSAVGAALVWWLGARRRAAIPLSVCWISGVCGFAILLFSLATSAPPSFAHRIAVIGKIHDLTDVREYKASKFSFFFESEDGTMLHSETRIILPHWGNNSYHERRTYRVVYLDDAKRDPVNEAIDIAIIDGPDIGWHNSRDVRPFGKWLGIPLGGALIASGFFVGSNRAGKRKATQEEEQAANVASGN